MLYRTEIEDGYPCEDCARSVTEWDRRGRCGGAIPDGIEQLPIVVRGAQGEARTSTDAYPVEFDVCPRSLMREDLYPDECAVAAIVSQAVHADIKRRWPDIPARLWSLACEYECAREAKRAAYQEAAYKVL